jgi:DNA replication and repair protein RecF
VIATRLRLRDFRSYATADVALGAGLTVVHGRNGAGKTNLLEALYFGCTGRSCRTSNEREVVRFDTKVARVEVDLRDDEGAEHALTVGFEPGEPKRLQADGVNVERIDVQSRPLICVFLPDRLELVKGPPALRRSHVDQVVAAMWPGRSATRRAYGQALAQRNALLARVRSGRASPDSLPAWDAELARHGIALRDDRAAAIDLLTGGFSAIAAALGLGDGAELRYKPRSRAADAAGLAAELAEHTASDLDRGFTGHGPHRDDLGLLRAGRELRAYGSQGEQRLALLALLLAEREALAATRRAVPLMLLDDVMSELDPDRRTLLAQMLGGEGQSVITTTDLAHVPGAAAPSVVRLSVADGAVAQDAVPA